MSIIQKVMCRRFYVGGPLQVRGFDHFAAGPQGSAPQMMSKTDTAPASASPSASASSTPLSALGLSPSALGTALGGAYKLTALALLSAPLWSSSAATTTSAMPHHPQHQHHHAEAANESHQHLLKDIDARAFVFANSGSVSDNGLTGALRSQRVSVGAGLSAQVGGMIRLELTYAVPVRLSSADRLNQFQFGIGLNM